MTTLKSICAFDIGIKNLSYCIIEYNNNIKSVLKWELLDLRSSRPTCIGQLKNKSICGKPAQFCCKSNNLLCYCKKHKTQYIPKSFSVIESENKHSCQFDDCDKKGFNILNSKTYCNAHLKRIQKKLTSENSLCRMKVVGCMKEPLYDLGTHMFASLDERPEILDVDKIVIENQPTLTNPTMKSISVLLISYFIMKKHKCVEFIAPSGKLKVNSQMTKNILLKCSKTNKYNTTKELGVKYCQELLNNFEKSDELQQLVLNSKKKDDLCDAFLHAYYHFFGECGLTSQEFIDNTTKYFETKLQNKKSRKINKENTIVLDI